MTTLNDLPIGKTATVAAVGGEGSLRQHFLDMGIIPLVDVTMVKHAPMGDPLEVRIHSYELTLRRDDARKIEIVDMRDAADAQESRPLGKPVPHPGLGEGGKFHDRSEENPLPEGTPLAFALVGNQNCGKTTLFNQLTGSNQHVGNFPGVTVDRKDGCIKGHPEACVTDLPGIYSMSPYSSEEVVTRRFLLDEKPRGIINIVDATNVERNLYLTMQLMELGMPMVLALNMMDEVEGNGGTIDVNEMEKLLGIPVVPISASKNEGIGELVDHALHVARFQEPPVRQDFCAPDEHDGAVHRCLHGIMALIEDHAERAGIPPRFAASKLAEGDRLVLERLDLDQNEKDALEHIICQMEAERGLDRAAAIADMRFSFIGRVCEQTVVKPSESREHARSTRIDKLLTGPVHGHPCVRRHQRRWCSGSRSTWWGRGCPSCWTRASPRSRTWWRRLAAAHVNAVLQSSSSTVCSTAWGSVSASPTIVTLFFFLSLLEDSGYMARGVRDGQALRRIGLSGRILPGWWASAARCRRSASRTLPSGAPERKIDYRRSPFMSRSAKLPIYAFFTAAFFPANGAAVMVGLVLRRHRGRCAGGAAHGRRYPARRCRSSGAAELPYAQRAQRGADAVEKARLPGSGAFTIIFLATIVIWFFADVRLRAERGGGLAGQHAGRGAGWIAPVFALLGFDDWRISTALVTGDGEGASCPRCRSCSAARPAWWRPSRWRRWVCWCSACCTRRAWRPSRR